MPTTPEDWRRRIQEVMAKDQPLYVAVFNTNLTEWQSFKKTHAEALRRTVQPSDSVLDAGCAYGRLLNLLPSWWRGAYLGIDLSPDFIALAKAFHPDRDFVVGDLIDVERLVAGRRFDWAILLSVDNDEEKYWRARLLKIRRVVDRLLLLNFHKDDPKKNFTILESFPTIRYLDRK